MRIIRGLILREIQADKYLPVYTLTLIEHLAIFQVLLKAVVHSKPSLSGGCFTLLNYRLSRDEMVLTQLEKRGIKDQRILEVMRKIKRHHFVEPAFLDRAYDDSPLPIEEGQTISQPYIVARMTGLLEVQPTDKVLEIGTGSGYQTALLAELAYKVFSIERYMSLSRKARARIEEQGYRNVILKQGDGTIGWAEFAPYDKIIVTAAAPSFPRLSFFS